MPDKSLPIIDLAYRLVLEVNRAVGHPPTEMDRLVTFSDDSGIWLLEDAAVATGATHRVKWVGTLARGGRLQLPRQQGVGHR